MKTAKDGDAMLDEVCNVYPEGIMSIPWLIERKYLAK